MVTFAFDSSVKNLTLAFIKESQIISVYNNTPPTSQSFDFIKIFDETLKQGGLNLTDISQALFCHGPGSFTSLRVGLSSLLGLFWGKDVKYFETSSLLFRCYAALKKFGETDRIVATIKLGRGRFAVGQMIKNKPSSFAESFFSLTDLVTELKDREEQVLLCGDGVEELKPLLMKNVVLINQDCTEPHAFLNILERGEYKETPLTQAKLQYMIEPEIGR